ncbi:MAG: NAD(P) transhydrogenase subunit alpha [Candidatus Azotimanducaceae bacterium]|jgi:NAD(P) transhydrogenase subunit alpha
MELETIVFLTFILVLSIFLGFELISKVPATLHTPLMSGANAISGITLAGAFLSAGAAHSMGSEMATYLGTAAVAFATINVVGGYLVTDRMLAMFKSKNRGKK